MNTKSQNNPILPEQRLSSATATESAEQPKYAVIQLQKEKFAVSLESIAEVCRSLPITNVPNSPVWLLGVTSIRGNMISVIDLNSFFGLSDGFGRTSKARIVILNSMRSKLAAGFLIDQMNEIVALSDSAPTAPAFSAEHAAAPFISSVVRHNEFPIHVLDVDRLLTSSKLAKLQEN